MLDRQNSAMVDRAVEAATARTPAEQPTPGQRLVASVEASVRAYRRGRAEGLTDFAEHLRGMARRGVNERVTESLLFVAEVADRVVAGEPPRRYCPDCKADVDNHHPCGEIDCACWCMDPGTPEHMRRPAGAARGGS